MSDIEQTGTLEGEIVPEVAIEGDITPELTLEGEISIPEKVFVGEKPRIREITLLASAWEGEAPLYHQVVEIEDVTENSRVDVTPSGELLVIYYEKDLTIVAENEDGIVTVYCVGQKLTKDYVMQASITEVEV